MTTSQSTGPLIRIVQRIASSAVLSLLAVAGLLMIPVSCTCGATVPHGHSLFELPFHHHGADDHADHEMDHSHGAHGVTPSTHEMSQEMCDSHIPDGSVGFSFATSNALESQQDGATLNAPPSSSVGHPMAMTTPGLIALNPPACERIALPPTRVLEGSQPAPETPPPQPTAII